uniref:EF-hand domain-containing protein n=1 Tax=Knipowitschia caucasica TaxID=637954 RepID=A0AAV2IXR5_KNICA
MDDIKKDTMMPDDHYSSKQEKRGRIRETERFFKGADKDGGGALGEMAFISATGPWEEELRALHMPIDANCDGTVDFNELLDFELGKHFAAKNRSFDNVFPLPIKIVDGGHQNKIVKIVARLLEKPEKNNNKTGFYISFVDPQLPQAEDQNLPQAEDQNLPQAEDQNVPQAEDQNLPQAEDQNLPQAEDQNLPQAEDQNLPQAEDQNLPQAED